MPPGIPELDEETLSARLQAAWQPGKIASMDGDASNYRGHRLKCAAVLLPLFHLEGEWHLVLTRRTSLVEHHKGQVSFPGGGCDPQDASAEATALREAQEEVGIHPGDVRLLGRLNDVLTITRYRITPVVGIIPHPYVFQPAPAEVECIFSLPLEWLAQPGNWSEQPFTPAGEPRPVPVVMYRPFEDEVLWGISARIVHNFLSVLGWM